MTLQQLLADCYRRLDYQAAPATAVKTRLLAFLNETQAALASEPGIDGLLRGTLPLTTTANRASYAIPPAAARVLAVYETTNDYRLKQETLDWYRLYEPDPSNASGTPTRFVMLGPQAVSRQPSNASEIWAKSTSNSDTPILHYEVRDSNGLVTTATVTLSGTTAVSFDATLTTIEEILDVYLDDPALGTVTIHEDISTGTELARIGPGMTRSAVHGIAFSPTPSSAITYTIDYEQRVTDLVIDTDEAAWLPEKFHRLLSLGARMREYEFKHANDQYVVAAAEYQAGVGRLKYFVANSALDVPVMGRAPRSTFNNLGGWYPAGSVWD